MVRLRVFVSAPFLNGCCDESLRGRGCGQRNTAFPTLQTLSQNTRGAICLNPPTKRLPDTAAAAA